MLNISLVCIKIGLSLKSNAKNINHDTYLMHFTTSISFCDLQFIHSLEDSDMLYEYISTKFLSQNNTYDG